jgi:hypothetical protein
MNCGLTTITVTPAAQVTIRPAAPVDADLIEAVLRDRHGWRQQTGSGQWQYPFPTEWIGGAIARAEFWIAWKDGQPVGVVRLVEADPLFWGAHDDGSALYAHTLAVPRGEQDWAILAWAAAEARARGRTRLRLDCAADATALCAHYERAGFSPWGPIMIGGEAMMLFERTLRG